jgi:hypothetical protein
MRWSLFSKKLIFFDFFKIFLPTCGVEFSLGGGEAEILMGNNGIEALETFRKVRLGALVGVPPGVRGICCKSNHANSEQKMVNMNNGFNPPG